MAITRAQTSVATALSSLRKSIGGSTKSSSKRTAAKSKITAPTAAQLRSAAAKKTLKTLQYGVVSKGYNYTPLPHSSLNRLA